MILPTNTPVEITEELKKDLEWVNMAIKKRARKLKLKICSSGITHRKVVEEYFLTSPLNNRWFVTMSLCLSQKTPLHTKVCCIAESEYGTPDYLILRGLTYGEEYHVRITSHTISRMKERDLRFKDMTAGQIANRIFPHGEDGVGIYTREEDIPKTLKEMFENKDGRKNLFAATSTGVFFGFQEFSEGYGNITFKTFVTPDMLYTHKELNMYRYSQAYLQLQKHMTTKYHGNMAVAVIDNSPEATELLEIVKEYESQLQPNPEVLDIPR